MYRLRKPLHSSGRFRHQEFETRHNLVDLTNTSCVSVRTTSFYPGFRNIKIVQRFTKSVVLFKLLATRCWIKSRRVKTQSFDSSTSKGLSSEGKNGSRTRPCYLRSSSTERSKFAEDTLKDLVLKKDRYTGQGSDPIPRMKKSWEKSLDLYSEKRCYARDVGLNVKEDRSERRTKDFI